MWGRIRLGTVISAKDLEPVQPQNIPKPPEQVAMARNTVKEWQELIDSVKDLANMFMQKKGGAPMPDQPRVFNPESAPINSTEGDRPAKNFKPKPDVPGESIITVDKQKLRKIMKEVIVTHATKLPTKVQRAKVKDIIGENWQNYKFSWFNRDIDSEFVLDKAVDEVEKIIKEVTKAN